MEENFQGTEKGSSGFCDRSKGGGRREQECRMGAEQRRTEQRRGSARRNTACGPTALQISSNTNLTIITITSRVKENAGMTNVTRKKNVSYT